MLRNTNVLLGTDMYFLNHMLMLLEPHKALVLGDG